MNAAKLFYEEFYKIDPPTLGPYINPNKITKRQNRKISNLKKAYCKKILNDIKCCETNWKENELFVPSPWHAWAFLEMFDTCARNMDTAAFGITSRFSMPVYRGHCDSSYKPIASLFRAHTDKEYEDMCLKLFTELFNQIISSQNLGLSSDKNYAKSAAQHYGIKTDFLDITVDPKIAIYFACKSNHKKFGDRASVLIFDLNNYLNEGFNLILPPPMVERLYNQCGSFFSQPTSGNSEHQKFIKLSFPYDSNFRLINKSERLDVLKSDPWLPKSVEWIKNKIKSEKLTLNDDTIVKYIEQLYNEIGYPNNYLKNPFQTQIRWIENFDKMIYWYGIRIKNNEEGLLSGVCKRIAEENFKIVDFMNQIRKKEIILLQKENIASETIKAKIRLQNFWLNILKHTNKST